MQKPYLFPEDRQTLPKSHLSENEQPLPPLVTPVGVRKMRLVYCVTTLPTTALPHRGDALWSGLIARAAAANCRVLTVRILIIVGMVLLIWLLVLINRLRNANRRELTAKS